MGKVWSAVKRPLLTFNIENRAHRVISKDKPKPAPRYRADAESLEKLMRDNPNVAEIYSRKDAQLNDRLKRVFVASEDPESNAAFASSGNPEKNPESYKNLPTSKENVEDFEFGIQEPDRVTPGRITLRSTLELLADHYIKKMPEHELLLKHKIGEDNLKNIVKYHGVFDIYIPSKTTAAQDKFVETLDIKKLAGKKETKLI